MLPIRRLAKPPPALHLLGRSQHHLHTGLSTRFSAPRRVSSTPAQVGLRQALPSCPNRLQARHSSHYFERGMLMDYNPETWPTPPAWLGEFRERGLYGFAVYRTYYGDGSEEHERQWARVQEKMYELTNRWIPDEPDESDDDDFSERCKDTWRFHFFDDRAVFDGVELDFVKEHFLEIALANMNTLIDRIAWNAALVIDQEAFDSIIAALEDPTKEKENRAFVWAADPDMDPDDVDEEEGEEYRYKGHYKMSVLMLTDFQRDMMCPECRWARMHHWWPMALDTPWPNWRRRDLS